MKNNKKANKGFTLYEITVYMLIFAVFMLFMALMFKGILKAHRFGKTRVDIQHNAAVALDSICKDLVTAGSVTLGGSDQISLNTGELAINYSKTNASGQVMRITYKILTNAQGIKQLIRSKVPVGTVNPPYEVVSDYVDDVTVKGIFTKDPYNDTYNLFESYRVKVITKTTGMGNVAPATFSLVSQITPRAFTSGIKLTPVVIEDKAGNTVSKFKLKPVF